MNKPTVLITLALIISVTSLPTLAKHAGTLQVPSHGVLCDQYVCADAKGLSRELTQKFLGKKAAASAAFRESGVDLTAFTFANGIFCDTKERVCREDRYYGTNGQHSGAVSKKYTHLLFVR